MLYIRIKNAIYYRLFRFFYKRKFKFFGFNSKIIFPLNINGMCNISIGNNVYIAYKTWLAALPINSYKVCDLIIGDGSIIGNFNHIYATNSIIIGKNVLTADKVYISDNLHSYSDVTKPILFQSIKQLKSVSIGNGTWLGENVCVIGANIGNNCVIGANSVVTKEIPDYCVAVGSPAKIIKRFCTQTQTWKETNYDGSFRVPLLGPE